MQRLVKKAMTIIFALSLSLSSVTFAAAAMGGHGSSGHGSGHSSTGHGTGHGSTTGHGTSGHGHTW